MPSHPTLVSLLFVVAAAAAQGPQVLTVPAAYDAVDAPSQAWVAGAQKSLHQQTLVGASHLGALLQHSITSLSFRRSALAEALPAGAAQLTVTLSMTPRVPMECSELYAANVGPNPVQVFSGVVTIPTSPAAPGPSVAWTPDNVIRIAFAQPFVYTGGTLCIDIAGATVPGQEANWWLADAAYDAATGTTVELGGGCGPFTNALGQWSYVAAKTLLPGSTAEMEAYGPVGNFAVAVVGVPGPTVPLTLLGFGQPGCNSYLGSIEILHLTQFASLQDPILAHRGGLAELRLPIPNATWVLGAQMATQWLDLVSQFSSNGVAWTISPQAPTLDMAMVDGVAGDTTGNVSTYKAHVLRFEHQ